MELTWFTELLLPNGELTNLLCKTGEGAGTVLRSGVRVKPTAEEAPYTKTYRCKGLRAIPPLCDLHAHLYEVGYAYRETLQTGLAAALAGGYGTVCTVPESPPHAPFHAQSMVEYIHSATRLHTAGCEILPVASALEADGTLPDYDALLAAGAAAFSLHAGLPDAARLYEVMCAVAERNAVLFLRPRFAQFTGSAGSQSTARHLGLQPLPASAESAAVAMAVAMAEETGCRVHLSPVTCAQSLAYIRLAKSRGKTVSCETAPPYFTFSDTELLFRGTAVKLEPPLRTQTDRDALRTAIADGTVDCICSDHTPREDAEKRLSFAEAAAGAVGLETAFAVSYTELVVRGVLSLPRLLSMMRDIPLNLLSRSAPAPFTPGSPADFYLLAPNECAVLGAHFQGKAHNTPFEGLPLFGVPARAVRGGILQSGKPS